MSSVMHNADHGVHLPNEKGVSIDLIENVNSDLLDALQAIILLNNEGVASYEEGKIPAARVKFQVCLDELFELKVELQGRELEKGAKSDYSSSSTTESSPIRGWSAPIETANDQYSHLFSRLVILEPQLRDLPYTTFLAVVEICTTCILFNKSLSLHSSDPNLAPSAVSSVFGTYERTFNAFRQLRRHQKSDDKQLRFHLDVLVLALFNNMGALFLHEKAQYHDAAECFRAGSGVILRLHSKQLEETLTEQEISDMCMNTWMVPVFTTPAA